MKVTEFKQLTHFLFLETVIMICSFLWFPGWKWKFTRDSCKLLFHSLSLALVSSCAALVWLLVIPLNGELTGRLDLKKKKTVSSKLKGPGPAVEWIFIWNVMAKTWRTGSPFKRCHTWAVNCLTSGFMQLALILGSLGVARTQPCSQWKVCLTLV